MFAALTPPTTARVTGIRPQLPRWFGVAQLMVDFHYTEREIMEEISPAMAERMMLVVEARNAAQEMQAKQQSTPRRARR